LTPSWTGHDERGNEVSATTCQDQVLQKCSTSYKTYYLDPVTQFDPRNDMVATSSTADSKSAGDTAYRTTYAYDTYGDLLSTTDPLGRTTSSTYTDGTSTYGSCDGGSAHPAPVGLEASSTTATGANTRYTYYADGDLCTVTNADGNVTTFAYDGLGRMVSKTTGHQLAADWPLTDGAGSASALDISGLGNAGAATDVTFDGSYASFPGTTGQGIVAGSPVLNTTASYSVSAWVDPSNASGYQPVVNVCGTSHCAVYLEENASGKWEFAAETSDAATSVAGVSTGAAVTVGAWAMVTGVFDASAQTLTLYVNGAKVGSVAWATPWAAAGPLTIGASRFAGSSTSSGTFTGGIANVQAYQRALSATEITTLYGHGRSGSSLAPVTGMNETTSYHYDAQGRLVQVTNPPVTDAVTGATHVSVSTYTYDDDGDVLATTVADWGGDDESRETTDTYNNYDQVASQTTPEGNASYTYDASGNQLAQFAADQDGANHTSNDSYDAYGNVLESTDAAQRATETFYDADWAQASGPNAQHRRTRAGHRQCRPRRGDVDI
jgi:YD repeat-containing protein